MSEPTITAADQKAAEEILARYVKEDAPDSIIAEIIARAMQGERERTKRLEESNAENRKLSNQLVDENAKLRTENARLLAMVEQLSLLAEEAAESAEEDGFTTTARRYRERIADAKKHIGPAPG